MAKIEGFHAVAFLHQFRADGRELRVKASEANNDAIACTWCEPTVLFSIIVGGNAMSHIHLSRQQVDQLVARLQCWLHANEDSHRPPPWVNL